MVADPARVQTVQSRGSLRDPALVSGANHDYTGGISYDDETTQPSRRSST
jgi:hypothetical protein